MIPTAARARGAPEDGAAGLRFLPRHEPDRRTRAGADARGFPLETVGHAGRDHSAGRPGTRHAAVAGLPIRGRGRRGSSISCKRGARCALGRAHAGALLITLAALRHARCQAAPTPAPAISGSSSSAPTGSVPGGRHERHASARPHHWARRPLARLGRVFARRPLRLRVRPRRRANQGRPRSPEGRSPRAAGRQFDRRRDLAGTARSSPSRTTARRREALRCRDARTAGRDSVRVRHEASARRWSGIADAPGDRFVFSLFEAGEIWVADPRDPSGLPCANLRDVGKEPYDGLVTPDGRWYIAGLFGEDGLALLDLWNPERRREADPRRLRPRDGEAARLQDAAPARLGDRRRLRVPARDRRATKCWSSTRRLEGGRAHRRWPGSRCS